eukprot:GABV01014179.1.p2 GENE.GABV01014179.1~~GABV01014179.1.p2  ORF type:complete len:100 (-),score=28.17 GABV01014179.1:3-302(-)
MSTMCPPSLYFSLDYFHSPAQTLEGFESSLFFVDSVLEYLGGDSQSNSIVPGDLKVLRQAEEQSGKENARLDRSKDRRKRAALYKEWLSKWGSKTALDA